MQQHLPGIWRLTFGEPELATPVSKRYHEPDRAGLARLPVPNEAPFTLDRITGQKITRGFVVELPLGATEQIYGLGLQLLSFNQRGMKKTLRVNSDPVVNLGDSHAPVPFYVSTAGYGVLVDTARYATFYIGNTQKVRDRHTGSLVSDQASIVFSTQDLQDRRPHEDGSTVTVEIPVAAGVDIYIFTGPTMREAIQRYNLFSGGGCFPPRWGLGVWYRCRADFDQQQVLHLADSFRADEIPCDVLGLEPGWQTHSYSCSFAWSGKFPEPRRLADALTERHYHMNLWTHAFTHASSPLYNELMPYAGDYEVWQGLVPDLTLHETRQALGRFFAHQHVDMGAAGYKLDECDNSDFNSSPWSFPELSHFPSGVDGEQMHSFFGLAFQETVDAIFREHNQRSYHDVRSSHALASPYSFVLYSDLYDQRDFIRGVVNSGFSGLLWTPEVRHAESVEDLVRRLQTVVFSPQAQINAWYIKNPPWKQWDRQRNNADDFSPDWAEVQAICRDTLRLRMRLLPYLYSSFYRYTSEGIPPFRALVMDYPGDPNTWMIDDEYLMGDRLLVAPLIAGQKSRPVYLPQGTWHDFWTNAIYTGGTTIDYSAPLTIIPLFIKDNTVLPLALPTLHTADPQSLLLDVRIYGEGLLPITLIEDDGLTYDYRRGRLNKVTLSWDAAAGLGSMKRDGDADVPYYSINQWQV